MSETSTVSWIVLLLLAFSGCGSGDSTRFAEKSRKVDPRSSTGSRPDAASATQGPEAPYDKVFPAVIGVRDSRFNLLHKAAITPENADELRIVAVSYRQALRLLRHQLFDLEKQVGAEATRQFVGLIIYEGFVFGPEIFAEMPPETIPFDQQSRVHSSNRS